LKRKLTYADVDALEKVYEAYRKLNIQRYESPEEDRIKEQEARDAWQKAKTEYNTQCRLSREASDRRAKYFTDEILPRMTAWVFANLKPGDVVRMGGTNDGGIRVVHEITENPRGYSGATGIISGYQIRKCNDYDRPDVWFHDAKGRLISAKHCGMTTNYVSKIMYVYDARSMKWFDLRKHIKSMLAAGIVS